MAWGHAVLVGSLEQLVSSVLVLNINKYIISELLFCSVN